MMAPGAPHRSSCIASCAGCSLSIRESVTPNPFPELTGKGEELEYQKSEERSKVKSLVVILGFVHAPSDPPRFVRSSQFPWAGGRVSRSSPDPPAPAVSRSLSYGL